MCRPNIIICIGAILIPRGDRLSIFAISDLHLSLSSDKPMDVFNGWSNYTEQIKANWTRLIDKNDTVVIPGDISWALKLKEAKKDFEFIDSLPGKKIILKGNHDLWWGTMSKLTEFLCENDFATVTPLFNNCVEAEGIAVCGTRGWSYDCPESETKILKREVGRLRSSLQAAAEKQLKPIVFLHYPPAYGDYVCREIVDVLKENRIDCVWHGHIHGVGKNNCVSEVEGIKLRLISCDCIGFTPVEVLR